MTEIQTAQMSTQANKNDSELTVKDSLIVQIKTLLTPEWKDIVGYEDFYQISNHGVIRSKMRMVYTKSGTLWRTIQPKNIKYFVSNTGYYIVGLNKNGKQSKYTVHRLVAAHFIQNTENKRTVNHKDGNKLNNTADES